jgi:hypothetical protein
MNIIVSQVRSKLDELDKWSFKVDRDVHNLGLNGMYNNLRLIGIYNNFSGGRDHRVLTVMNRVHSRIARMYVKTLCTMPFNCPGKLEFYFS